MPKVQLKIEVNDNAETESLGDITNQVNNEGTNENISNVSIQASDNGIYVVGAMNKNGREMLSFGEDGNLVFNIDGFLSSDGIRAGALASEQDPDMFVWGVVPESKEYHVKLTFINATNLREIVVYGDPIAGQYPTEAIVNGITTIYSDDNRWAINLGNESTTHTIEFTKWSRAGYNACLTLIKVMLRYFDIANHTGLLEVESLSQSNSNSKGIMYGLVPSTGRARINVFDELRDLIEEGIITNNKNAVEIYVDGTKVQHHITTESDYETNRVLTMEFENHLSFLENIYGGRNLTDPMNAYDLLSEVLGTLNYSKIQIDDMLKEEIVYGLTEHGTIKSYLEKITIEYPYLESATYRETLDKFCVLAQLNLLEDDNGNLKFVSARPVEVKGKDVIVIPVNRQFSSFSKDEFVKNKYVAPFVQYSKFISSNNTFGDTLSVSYLEDNGRLDEGYLTVVGQSTFATPVTLYDVSANDNNKNSLSEDTIMSDESFKTSVSIKLAKGTIIKDISTIKLSINGNKAGTNTQFYTDDSNALKPYNYLPYKSASFNAILDLDDEITQKFSTISISNVSKTKEQIKFDILFTKPPTKMKYIGSNSQHEVPYFLSGTLQLYGEVYDYSMINNEKSSDIEINGNELIQDGTLYNNSKKIYELNRDNIVYDYSNGVRTAKVTVGCLDYYNENGELAVNWADREIIKVGDIVRIDRDNNGNSIAKYSNGEPYLWKVVGRNFRYSGVSLIDLQLQEVKLIDRYEDLEKYYVNASVGVGANLILERLSSNVASAPLGKIKVDEPLFYGDVINVSWTLDSGYATDTAYLNGNQIYQFNTNKLTVDSNITIVINTKTIGYQEIWSGEYNYQFGDLTTNEMQIELPTTINTKYGLRLTFERVVLYNVNENASADEITNITREIPFTLSSEFGSWWDSRPIITFEYKQSAVETTNKLKTVRIAGSYGGSQYIVGAFKLKKIEQYSG